MRLSIRNVDQAPHELIKAVRLILYPLVWTVFEDTVLVMMDKELTRGLGHILGLVVRTKRG